MRKLILIAHISVDGYVAGPNGEFDNFVGGEENLEFVCDITDGADAALFGRVSYQLLNGDWPTAANKPNASVNTIRYSNWYNRVLKIVLSTTLQSPLPGNAIAIKDNLAKEINRIKQQPGKDILTFGSPTAVHSLMELKLIDGFWLLIHPVYFGKGIRLFKASDEVTKLTVVTTKQLKNGMVAVNYIVRD